MRLMVSLAVAVAFCTASSATAAPKFQLDQTSWTYANKDGTKVVESVDADGNYIVNTAAGKHLDHGTAVMKNGKACFTSAMTKEGEVCWTTSPVKIGHSLKTVSSKGQKLTVTRTAYSPLKMPE